MASFYKVLSCLGLLAILLCAGCSGNDSDQAAKPNILLILTDDLGNNDIASWGDGQAPTPRIDELSKASIRFRQHYTDSTCSPSRAALLTGKEPVKVGFTPTGLGLSPDLATLPEHLKELGYRTIHLGKWHVGEALDYPEIQPSRHGFDYWFGMLNHFVLRGPGPHGEIVRRQPTHIDPWLQDNGAPPKQYQGYLDDILVDKAIEQLQTNQGQPWFINLWLYSPHTPYQPSPTFASRFPATPEGQFLAVLAQLDHNIDRLLLALEASGQAENTIVVFASDNGGPNIARNNNWPLQGKKAMYLEGGQRTPLLLRWPKHFENSDVLQATTIMDIFPTLIDLAGAPPPRDIDGQSLVRLMRGKPYQPPENLFFAADEYSLGMSSSVRDIATRRLFYHPAGGISQTAVLAAPTGSNEVIAEPEGFNEAEAKKLIREWEQRSRPITTIWKPGTEGAPAELTGRDYQRAPVFEGYTIGLSLSSSEPTTINGPWTLIEQPGIWTVQLLPDRRLKVLYGDVEQFSQPIPEMMACNRIVISIKMKERYTFPFPYTPQAKLMIYWNGRELMHSNELLSRPLSAAALSQPTYIGARSDGSESFPGSIDRPIIVNKFLAPVQAGYSLDDLQQRLCIAKP